MNTLLQEPLSWEAAVRVASTSDFVQRVMEATAKVSSWPRNCSVTRHKCAA